MTIRFPDASQFPSSLKTHIDHNFNHMIVVAKKGTGTRQLKDPKAIAIDTNTREIYVVHSNPICVLSIFSEFGEFIRRITPKHISDPGGIAIRENNIYLTDIVTHYVVHFRKEAGGIHYIGKQGGRGQTIGKFHCPKKLSVSSDGDVFVADCWNNRVQILDSDLYYRGQISDHSLYHPVDVKLMPEEVYVLALGCIRIFSYAGKYIRSLTIPCIGSFFCLDSSENILINHKYYNYIRIFRKDGTLLNTFGEPGYGMSFQNPQGICLIGDYKTVVISEGVNSLHILV